MCSARLDVLFRERNDLRRYRTGSWRNDALAKWPVTKYRSSVFKPLSRKAQKLFFPCMFIYIHDQGIKLLEGHATKLSVIETNWTGLWARTDVASSGGVFFERAICSRERHVETFRREEEVGRVNFYSPQSSTVIKSKMAATTILRTRTRFRPPKIRLHCRLGPMLLYFLRFWF